MEILVMSRLVIGFVSYGEEFEGSGCGFGGSRESEFVYV